jgi:Zn-dependent protease
MGVDVRIHWTFVFLIGLVVLGEYSRGLGTIVAGLLWILVIFSSVLLHELAHCVVAIRNKVVVDDILLLPIGGVSQMESIPKDPKKEFAIAVVGPLTSLGLAVFFAAIALLSGTTIWPPTLLGGSWIARIAWLNLLLGLFNLLPALPMDGGRLLRAALSMREDRRLATAQAAKVARVIAVTMIAVGFVYDVWLIFIGAFILFAVGAEQRNDEADEGAKPT